MGRIASIKAHLQRIDGLIADLERKAANDAKPSTLANIRALKKEKKKLEEELNRATAQTPTD